MVESQLSLKLQCILHTHPFNGPLSGTTRVSQYQKGKPIWILLKQETVSGSGITWAICKSAPRSRQTTTPAPHHSVFYRADALPAAQPCQSTEGKQCILINGFGQGGTSHGPVSDRPSVRLSVCLSVSPSVTSRSSTKTVKRRITQTTPHDSPRTLVFCCQRSPRNSTGVTPYGGAECRWGG